MKKIGLAGYVCATGIGTLVRWFWRTMPFKHLLAVHHPLLGLGADAEAYTESGRPIFFQKDCTATRGERFLNGLDAVLVIERAWPDDFVHWCRTRDIKLYVYCMAEWVDLHKPWFRHASLLIAPTRHCYEHLCKLGQEARSVYCPCPVDLAELPYVRRSTADSFMFSNGFGGGHQRKGVNAVAALAERAPQLPLSVYSQVDVKRLFEHTTARLMPHQDRGADLYRKEAVSVQPSRYEGLGLSILEALASGLPVITTDAAPMNEPIRAAYGDGAAKFLARVRAVEQVAVWSQNWDAHDVDVAHLAELAAALHGTNISEYSARGRFHVETHHGPAAATHLWDTLQRA